jgi:hypothetical protein
MEIKDRYIKNFIFLLQNILFYFFQLVQVANDGQKPVTFRNQSGQVLQATPITVVAAANQPVIPTYPVNGDCSLRTFIIFLFTSLHLSFI